MTHTAQTQDASLDPGRASGFVVKTLKNSVARGHLTDMPPPRASASELDATVALQFAMEHGARVVVTVRDPTDPRRPPRMIEGVPVDFRLARDGRERVVLEIQPETFQFLLLERIARVAPADPER